MSCKIGHHCHLAATGETKRRVSKRAAILLILLFPYIPIIHSVMECLDDG